MSATTITRDYSLVGPEADKAVAAGNSLRLGGIRRR